MSQYAPLHVATRVWTTPVAEATASTVARYRTTATGGGNTLRWQDYALAFDCETSTDAAQALALGWYRVYRWSDTAPYRLVLVEEGIFYADDLARRDPNGYSVLVDTCAYGRAAVGPDGNPKLMLRSREEFVRKVFYPVAYNLRGTVVGFNLPFDLSRLATHWGKAAGKMYGGYTLRLVDRVDAKTGERTDSRFHPNIRIKSHDSKRASMRFRRLRDVTRDDRIPDGSPTGDADQGYRWHGCFLDVRTLAFALTDKAHSLKSLAEILGTEHRKIDVETHGEITPEYVAYARNDVLVTAECLEQLRGLFDTHLIDLRPEQARSPASIAKAYWRAMGFTPPATRSPQWTPELLGATTESYFGGRAECGVRKVSVPVVHPDFTSMYPTVYTNMGLHRFMIAEAIGWEDATAEVHALLESVTLDRCFDRAFWRELPAFVWLTPNAEVLPVRADFDGPDKSYNIAVSPVTSDTPLCYELPDLVASVLKTGRIPKIERAFRLTAIGKSPDLKPVRFGGVVEIDPNTTDPIRALIEERIRVKQNPDLDEATRERVQQLLKTCANIMSYGAGAEINREDAPKRHISRVSVFTGGNCFTAQLNGVEKPGTWCFMPFASIVTAAARLMLTVLECCVIDTGGTIAFMDTDSACVVASRESGTILYEMRTPDGRLIKSEIRALSWAQVLAIVDRFAALNPYDPNVLPGSILKIEDVNYPVGADGKPDKAAGMRDLWCYAIASKRYCFFTRMPDGGFTIVDRSEHGLGHLLDPTKRTASNDPDQRGWITELWEYVLARALGIDRSEPDWLDRPAIGRVTITRPEDLDTFAQRDADKPRMEQVGPFNFMLVAFPFAPALFAPTDGAGEPVGPIAPQHFRLVAPYDPIAGDWLKPPTRWYNPHDGSEYRLHTCGEPPVDEHMARGSDAKWRPQKHDARPYLRVKSMRDVVNQYVRHSEPKRLGADGEPCHALTVGPLTPRPVVVDKRLRRYIGKEANRIEEALAGLITNREEVCRTIHDPVLDPVNLFVRPVLSSLAVGIAARAIGCEGETVRLFLKGKALSPAVTKRAVQVAGAYAWLAQHTVQEAAEQRGRHPSPRPTVDDIRRRAGIITLTEAIAACEVVVGTDGEVPETRRCATCRRLLVTKDPRAIYCCEACRSRARRGRHRHAQFGRRRQRRPLGQPAQEPRHD